MGPISLRTSDVIRQRWKVTVAGALFGSAICLGLLYCPRVCDVTYFRNGCIPEPGLCGNWAGPPWCLQDLKIVVFDRVVVEGTLPEETGRSVIRIWRLRVMAVLVLVGGWFGVWVGMAR